MNTLMCRTLALTLVAGGCATAQPAVGPGLEAPPAELAGGDAQLSVEHGLLLGRVRGGAYDVAISAGGARGRGPFGPIDVHIKKAAGGYDVAGMWNGGPISFAVTDTAIRGSALRQVSNDEPGLESCTYDVEKLWHRPVYAGRAECLGVDSDVRLSLTAATRAGLSDEEAAVLIIAYLVAPPIVI